MGGVTPGISCARKTYHEVILELFLPRAIAKCRPVKEDAHPGPLDGAKHLKPRKHLEITSITLWFSWAMHGAALHITEVQTLPSPQQAAAGGRPHFVGEKAKPSVLTSALGIICSQVVAA